MPINPTNRWTRAAERDSQFAQCSEGCVDTRRRVNSSMKPGRVKRKFGSIGSPFYSRSHELATEVAHCFSWPQSTVRRSSFSTARFLLKLTRELFVISIIPNLLSDHLTNTFDCYQANQCWSANARKFDDEAWPSSALTTFCQLPPRRSYGAIFCRH